MKKVIYLYLLVTATSLLFGLHAAVTLHITDNPQNYDVLDTYNLLEEFTLKYPDKNILFYVHGRKKDVEDEKERIRKLEKFFNVKVLMFHWNSYDKFLNRPTKNAEEASLQLFEALQMIRDFKNNHTAFFQNRSINLLCHSMGNLVLKYTIEKYFDDFEQEEVFTNYIGNAPDVPLKNHAVWLSRFKMAKRNYIMMNDHDFVLTFSYLLDVFNKDLFQYRLGLGFDGYIGRRDDEKNKLVRQIQYIDFSKVLRLEHGYFAYNDREITEIFRQVLNGNIIEDAFTKGQLKITLNQEKELQNVYRVLKKP